MDGTTTYEGYNIYGKPQKKIKKALRMFSWVSSIIEAKEWQLQEGMYSFRENQKDRASSVWLVLMT